MIKDAKFFMNHYFHNSWKELKEQVDLIKEKNITDDGALVSTARFKKVVEYIDKYLKIIDTDLITESDVNQLDDFSSYIESSKSQVIAFNSNYQVSHINSANANLDNLLDRLKKFHTLLPKVSGQGVASMLKQYGNTIENSLSEIDFSSAQESSDRIQALKQRLIDGEEDQESVQSQIDNLLEDFKEKQKELNDFYDQTLNNDMEGTTFDQIETNKELLEGYKKSATEDINELTNRISEFNKFYVTVFGEKDSETDLRSGGLKEELNRKLEELSNFKDEQEEVHQTLKNQIESFLPGATSAGLATAYHDERSKFTGPANHWNLIFMSVVATIFIVAFFSFAEFGIDAKGIHFSLSKTSGFVESFNSLIHRIPLYAPLVWLAIYAGKRRSEYQRLEQEYAHKESLSKSYIGYKNQIDKLDIDKDDLSVKLLNAIIDSTSKNASETLGKHSSDTPSQEALGAFSKILDKVFEKNTDKTT